MRYLIGGAVLLLAGVAAVVFVAKAVLLDPERLERRIAEAVGTTTGQALDATGGVDLVLLPQPVLTLHRPRLGTPEAGLMISADRLDLDLALRPLLLGSLEVDQAHLVRPELRLGGDPAAAFEALAEHVLRHGSALPARRLSVTGGTVAALTGESLLLDLDGLIEREGEAGSSRLRADARLASTGEATRLGLNGLIGSAVPGRPLPLQLELGARLGTATHRLAFRGQLLPGPASRGLAGRLTLDLPATPVPLAAELAGVWPELGELPVPDMPVALSGDLALELADGRPSLRLEEASLDLAGQSLAATLLLEAGTAPSIELALDADRLVLDGEAGEAAAFARRLLEALPVDLAGRIALRAAVVEWRERAFRQVTIDLAPDGLGSLEVARATAVLPGPGDVSFRGRLAASGNAGEPLLSGELELALQEPADLLAAFLPPPAVVRRSATLALETRLEWQPSRLTLRDADLRLDALHAAGGLAYRQARAETLPQLAVWAAVDRLALDDLVDPAAQAALLEALLDAASGTDLGLDLRVSRASLADLRFGSLTARFASTAGTVAIERLGLNDIAGSALAVSGRVHAPSRTFDLELALDVASLSRLLRLIGQDPPLTLALLGPLNLRGALAGDPQRAELTLALDADLLQGEGVASITDWLTAPAAAVALRVEAGEAAALLRQLAGIAVTDSLLGGPLEAGLELDVTANGLRAALLELTAGELTLSLDAARTSAAPGPLDRFDLRLGPLTAESAALLYRLLTPPLDLVPGPPGLWLGHWPGQALTWDWLEAPPTELAVTLDGADPDLPPITFNAQLRDGTLTIPALRWAGNGGVLDAGLALVARPRGVDLTLDLALERFAADQALALLGARPEALRGMLDLEARLTTHGTSLRALVGNLEGALDLVVTEGVLGAATAAGGGMPLDRLDATLAVERGVVGAAGEGVSFSGPDGTGRIDGYADLLAWIVDLDLALDGHDGAPLIRQRLIGPLAEPLPLTPQPTEAPLVVD